MENLMLKTSLIGLAAFLHDIGKPYQRTGNRLPEKFAKDSFEWQMILNKDSHYHALHTANFFDNHLKNIQKLFDEEFKVNMSIISAGHHNPNNDYLSQLIAKSDQIASGLDREEYEKKQSQHRFDYRKVMLSPLIRMASLYEENNKDYRYPLDILNVNSIFPVHKDKQFDEAEDCYKKIIKYFEESLTKLDGLPLNLFIDGLITLMEDSFSLVPSSTLGEFDDISLYDHLKTTAAIATSLYKYNDKKLPNEQEKSFLIIRGEFFGIQKFIFSEGAESGKNPAKILRGRSFYVSLLTEIAANMILKKLNLPSFNLMINAAGMFVILADNTDNTKNILNELNNKINDWLFNKFLGEVYFGIATTEASSNDFTEKHFETLWLNILTEMEKIKYSRFDLINKESVFYDYHKQFENNNVCGLCGKESVKKGKEFGDNCDEFIQLGASLVNHNNRFIIIKNRGLIFGEYDYYFCENIDLKDLGNLSKVIDISLFKQFSGFYRAKINTYVATENHRIKTFEELAELDEDTGIKAIGVFKADVDNLGALLAIGLEEKYNKGENKKLTFSRLSQLSRTINNFFAYYLPYKLQKDYPNMYTVFAGGDDLFIIGRYDKIFELALELSKDFKKYTGENKEVTISGGISIFKPNTPIAFMAETVEHNLEQSKKLKDDKHIKGNLTFLGATAKWDDFSQIYEEVKTNHLPESTSFYYKILELIEMRVTLDNNGKMNVQEILKNVMWIPRLKYLLGRQIKNENSRLQLAKHLIKNIDSRTELFRSITMFEMYKRRKHRG